YALDNSDPQVQALKEGESLPSETFVVKSADGSAQHTVTVAITGTNDAFALNDEKLQLQESELAEHGKTHMGDALTSIGADASSSDYGFTQNQNLGGTCSGGLPLSYEVSADGHTLKGYVTDGGGRTDVLQVTIDGSSGHYDVELFKPLDHHEQGKDEISLDLNIILTSGTQSDTGVLRVNIIDSVPNAVEQHYNIDDVQPQSNAVVIVLDMSNSMDWNVTGPDGTQMTRWQLTQNALKSMFESYDKQGDVTFKIATFMGNPEAQTSGWINSLGELDAFFKTIHPFGPTPYNQGLEQLGAILDDAKSQQTLANANGQFYFISDGSPTDFRYDDWTRFPESRATLMTGLTPEDVGGQSRYDELARGDMPNKAEQQLMLEKAIEKELADHNQPFDNIWSFGIGKDAKLDYLTPLATDKGTALVVENDADFINILTSSIPGQIQGDLTQEISAEAQWVQSISVEGETYFFDRESGSLFRLNKDPSGVDTKVSNTSLLTVKTSAGRLVLNFETGKYDYQAKDLNADHQDAFDVVIRDADGDVVDTRLVIDVRDLKGATNHAPEFISNGDTPQGTDLDGKPTVDHDQFNVPELKSSVMVGKVTAIDQDAGDKLTYSLTAGQGDKFEINAQTGEIWLKEGATLTHDEQAQHLLKVQVSDGVASDEMDVTVNVIENRAPVNLAVHGFADVEIQPINKVTIMFDYSNSMTRTFDGTNTVRDHNKPTEVLAPRYESRAYQAAEALHKMVGQMIAEGGQSNTYIRLVTFSSDVQKQGWLTLDEIYEQSKPPELNGRALTDRTYLNEVYSYVAKWCNIDRGIYTDYALAQETVMGSDRKLSFPWQEAMAEGKTGKEYWDILRTEQPVKSVNTIFFITDGEPNPQPGSVPATDLKQRWDDYVQAQNAKVYSIGIAVEGNAKVDEALHNIGDEVVYVDSNDNLSHYLNHFAPKPISGDLLAGSTDADGDTLTVALATDRFSLLGADLHDVKIDGPLVTDSQLEDGKLSLTTAFGVLAVASNGSYSFTQSDGSPLLDGQQVDLHFQFQVEDGRGGISDNVFTLTLTGRSVDQALPVEVNPHTQAGDQQDNILTGTDQADVLLGQSGNDTLHGGDGNDILLGGSGSDHLYGNLGNDILTGGAGNDFLAGGLGNDILIGDRGADTFIWGRSDIAAGVDKTDVIRDFSVAEHDTLDLADILPPQADHNSIDSLLQYLNVEAKSDGVTIHVATEVTDKFDLHIDLQGVQMAELSTHSTQTQILDDLLQANIIHV
ncbi:VCBS domain-containing protein, partial [Aeromonas aquatilis]